MSTVIYHERFLQRLLDQRYHWETRERDTRKALYDALTLKQLNDLHYGKLRTKRRYTTMLLGAWKEAQEASRGAWSAYSYYLDRVRSDKAAS